MRYVVVGTGNISNTYVSALAERPDSALAGAASARLTTELILSIYQNAV